MSQGGNGVLKQVTEQELPASCRELFQRFEERLQWIGDDELSSLELSVDGEQVAFIPDVDAIKPRSLGRILGITALLAFLVILAFGVLGVVALLALPEAWSGVAAQVVYGLGALLLVVIVVWQVGGQLRENRRIRAQDGPAALGLYLTADALIQRAAHACWYYPRDSVVAMDWVPIISSGGSSAVPRCVGHALEMRYLDADGRKRKKVLHTVHSASAAQPQSVQRVKRWFGTNGADG